MDENRCETCAYWDDNAGGCPFVDGCQYEPSSLLKQIKDPRRSARVDKSAIQQVHAPPGKQVIVLKNGDKIVCDMIALDSEYDIGHVYMNAKKMGEVNLHEINYLLG